MTNSIKKRLAVCMAACMTLMQGALLPTGAAAAEENTNLPDFSVLGAVGKFTEEETAAIAGKIYEGLANHRAEIDLKDGDMPNIEWTDDKQESLSNVYRCVVTGWDVGILTKKDIAYVGISDITKIKPNYFVEEGYESEYAAMMALLDEAVEEVNPEWSDVGKALYLHDWMADEFQYDPKANGEFEPLSFTAYGMLKNGIGACDGYAWLYNILLRRVGVNCQIVDSQHKCHAWNVVEIDDVWYHVDVTWDDVYPNHVGMADHDNFLRSAHGIYVTTHPTRDWYLTSGKPAHTLNENPDNPREVKDDSKYEDAFWKTSRSSVRVSDDGNILFDTANDHDKNAVVVKEYDFSAELAEPAMIRELNSFNDNNHKWRPYVGNFSAMATYNGDVFYTTSRSIYAIREGQHGTIWVANLDNASKETGWIYGMYIDDDGYLHYQVGVDPLSSELKEMVVDLHAPYSQLGYGPRGEKAETTTATEPVMTTTTEAAATTETTTTTEMTTTTAETTVTTVTTTTGTETTVTETEEPFVAGDANGDGDVGVVDAVALQRYLLGDYRMPHGGRRNCDLTNDGVVDAFDLVIFKRAMVEANDAFNGVVERFHKNPHRHGR